MEKIELILKEKRKSEKFIQLIKKMFIDYNINEEKSIEILKRIYK